MLLFEAEPSGSVLQLILAERRSILKLWLMTMDSAIKKLLPSQHKRKGLLKHQLHLVKRKDCDRYEIAPIPDPLSFDKGFFLFIRACQLLTQQMEGVVLVGLAGPSGAGKTVFTEKVSNFMPGIAIICMDNYNVASRVIDENYDDPRIIDYDTLLENINDLRAGKPANVPIYDYKTSSRIGFRCVEEPSSRVVIIEGIYALSEKLRPLLDLRVSVTGGVHFDLVKRVLRDINRSGQAPEDIIHQISETVYPMYKAFIEPDLETAHIKIVNKFNPFSGFQNPTYILKSTKSVTEDQIRAALMPDHTETTEETYDMYLLPPAEDLETCQSYLRMRNRDGKYSLMFEEWVTDGPFIISPRITFEVSVRLLGGLMALGYEIATLLKRTSHVFSDEKLVIKIDSLEQLQRKYVQVQGKDRSLVADAGKKLGLQGSYIPRSYIEQIQLEKLTAEVTAIPEELMTKLSLTDNMILSPLPSPSPSLQRRYSRSQSWHLNTDISTSLPNHEPITRQPRKKISKPPPLHIGNLRDEQGADSPAFFQGEQGSVRNISEQLAAVNEKLDELVSRLGELEKRLPSGSLPRQNSVLFGASTGPSVGSFGSNGAYANGPISTTANGPISLATSSLEYPLGEEIKLLSRGQCHINSQLDVLTNLLRENLRLPNQQKKVERRIWDGPIRNMKTTDSGLAIAAVLIAVGLSSAIVIARTFKPR